MRQPIQTWKLSREKTASLELITLPQPPGTLDEGTRQIPQGGYTTLRTYPGARVLLLMEHFQRLEDTALLSGIKIQIDQETVRRAIRQVHELFPAENERLRIVMDLEQDPGTLYFLAETLVVPGEADFRDGVRTVTRRMQRENPKAKLTGFIAQAAQVRLGLPAGINEAIMIGADGMVLEGLSSNFFGVKDGVVSTADSGVLFGITRSMVIEVIEMLGIPISYRALPEHALANLDEAFITSASRSVLPVTEVDGRRVGDGNPGSITRAVLEKFQRLLDERLETL